MDCHLARRDASTQVNAHGVSCRIVALNTLERSCGMFQHEELRDAWQDEAHALSGNVRWEEASLSSSAGQKLIQDASRQTPTAVQCLSLALVSFAMLMGTSSL